MMTVREVALAWWREKHKKPEQEYYQNFLDLYILRFLGDVRLADLTAERMDAYFAQVYFEQHYRNALSRMDSAYGKSILQGIFDYAEARGWADNLPKADLSYRINPKAAQGCAYSPETAEQIKRLIIAEMAEPVGLAMGLAWYAGLTREELLELTYRDVDFERGVINVGGRAIPLEEPLTGMLRVYADAETEQYIFISRKKTRFAAPSMSLLVRKAKERHGIDDQAVSLSGLRNDYIIRKLRSIRTEDLPDLAAGLGISPIGLIAAFGGHLNPAEIELSGVKGLYRGRSKYIERQMGDRAVYDAVWRVVIQAISQGEAVSIEGLGLFYVRETPERYVRNWMNFEFEKTPAERHVAFLPYPALLFGC